MLSLPQLLLRAPPKRPVRLHAQLAATQSRRIIPITAAIPATKVQCRGISWKVGVLHSYIVTTARDGHLSYICMITRRRVEVGRGPPRTTS